MNGMVIPSCAGGWIMVGVMSSRRGSRYARWVYGNRALWSSPKRTTLSIGLILAFVATQTLLLLGGARGWIIWIIPAVAIVTWVLLGRMWLNRDLTDSQMEVELRAILDGSE
jgi:hypothetical protein